MTRASHIEEVSQHKTMDSNPFKSTEQQPDDDPEPLALSSTTLAALHSFLAEQRERETAFAAALATIDTSSATGGTLTVPEGAPPPLLDMDVHFQEDWQLSQFWYTKHTASTLAREALAATTSGQTIICISSPSAFLALHHLLSTTIQPNRNIYILEYDQRFALFRNQFIPYDYCHPTAISHPPHSADYLIVDPPFLSDECWEKVAQTARYLAKPQDQGGCRMTLCTGKVMGDKVKTELGCHETSFLPQHQNGLANEFRCYANYPVLVLEKERETDAETEEMEKMKNLRQI